MSDPDLVARAEATIAKIASTQRELGEQIANGERAASERFAQLTRKVEDLQRAQEIISSHTQGVQRAAWFADVGGSDQQLRQFVDGDTVRLVDTTAEEQDEDFGIRGMVTRPGLLTGRPVTEVQRDLQEALVQRAWIRSVLPQGTPTPKADGAILRALRNLPKEVRGPLSAMIKSGAIRRAFGDTATLGTEWIPTTFNPQLWRPFELQSDILGLFDTIQVDGPVTYPQLTGEPTPFIQGKTISNDPAKLQASEVATADKTINFSALSVRVSMALVALEDAAAFVSGEVMRTVMKALRDALDDCAVNGDTTATHLHTGLPSYNPRSRWQTSTLGGSASHLRFFKGLIKLAKAGSGDSDQSAATTFIGALLNIMAILGERGAADDLVCLVSPEYYISDVLSDTNLLTVDKFGAQATISQSPMAGVRAFNVPIIPTRWLKEDKTAAGIFDGTTMTKDSFLVASKADLRRIQRRGAIASMVTREEQGAAHIVASAREVLELIAPDATTAVGYAVNLN